MQNTSTTISKRMRSIIAAFRGDDQTYASLLSILGLMFVFAMADGYLRRVRSLPAESYEEAVVLVAFLKNLPQLGWWLCPALPILALLAVRYRQLACRWADLQHGRAIRVLIVAAALLLAWAYSTYDFNLYFDQAHMVDRILVIILSVATVWRPFFVLPFLLVLVPLISQFSVPLHGFTWSIPYLPIRILLLFSSMLLIGLAVQSRKTAHFVFGVGCIFAAHYWPSGLGKIRLGWLMTDHVYFLLPNTYANGWLGFLEPETIGSITQMWSKANLPSKVAALLLECGALFFLWKRSLMITLLGGWMVLHTAIFLGSGICLWLWVLLDALLLLIVWRFPAFCDGLFSGWHRLVSTLLISTTVIWMAPVSLAWLDARATYTYRFEVVVESGDRHWLPPKFFRPNDYEFSINGFRYLSPHPILPITWGATIDPQVADSLADAVTSEQVLSIERELGDDYYNADRAETLKRFLIRFVGNYNRRRSKLTWLSRFSPPPRVWTYFPSSTYAGNERITQVNVHQVLSFYDGNQYHEIRSLPVLQVEIPTG